MNPCITARLNVLLHVESKSGMRRKRDVIAKRRRPCGTRVVHCCLVLARLCYIVPGISETSPEPFSLFTMMGPERLHPRFE